MKSFRIGSSVAAVLIVLTALTVRAADQVANPVYKSWSAFKVGSNQTLAGTSAMPNGMSIQVEIKRTLVELTDDHAVVETSSTVTFSGQQHSTGAHRTTIPAKTDKVDWKEGSPEDVKAMGRTFKCRVIDGGHLAPQQQGPGGGSGPSAEARIWFSEEVPGGIVQMKFNSSNSGTPGGGIPAASFLLQNFEAK